MNNTDQFADAGIAEFVARASFTKLDIAALRAGAEQRATTRDPGPSLVDTRDVTIGGCPARVHRPFAGRSGPAVLWLHGGGWTFGSSNTHDRMSRRLAARSQAAVITLDYHLAPEHPWPQAVQDVTAALLGLTDPAADLGFEPKNVAVGGDSAGGLLAALACIRLRDAGSAALPDLQVLAYANTDLACDRRSMTEKASGYGLDADTVRFFNRQWVPDEAAWGDPRVSPLRVDSLGGLPPALVVTAEHDPLRDQGEAYAERLQTAGVPVRLRRELGLIHNFLLIDQLSPAAAAAAERIADDIRELMDH